MGLDSWPDPDPGPSPQGPDPRPHTFPCDSSLSFAKASLFLSLATLALMLASALQNVKDMCERGGKKATSCESNPKAWLVILAGVGSVRTDGRTPNSITC